MTRFFILFLFLCLSSQGYSQWIFGKNPYINKQDWDKQRVHWGYYLGFNSYDFKINYDKDYFKQMEEYEKAHQKEYTKDYKEVQVTSSIGFNVGLVGNLRLFEYLDLRFEPGLYYNRRELTYPASTMHQYATQNLGMTSVSTNELGRMAKREVNATYIHLPLLLKFSSKRTGNIRPYLLGGLSADLNLTSNNKSERDNSEGNWRAKKWTTNYELGVGVDIYFPYFKFSPSLRGVFGLDNEMVPDNNPNSPWTSQITSMKTRGIFINFTFH